MKTAHSLKNDSPLYAPCRKLMVSAPFEWLKKGWQDFRRAPWHSLVYGVIFAAMGWLLVYFYWTSTSYLIVGLFISLLVVGPALAFGLYDISWQLEHNNQPTFSHERGKALHEMGHELMLALLLSLMFMFLLALVSIGMNIVATVAEQAAVSAAVPLSDTGFLVIAVIFGGLLFGASSFALPMILDRDTDAMTAINTSFHAVWRNKSVLAIWGLLILALTAVGFATALIGFVLIVPVLGYATWHAYRETIVT